MPGGGHAALGALVVVEAFPTTPRAFFVDVEIWSGIRMPSGASIFASPIFGGGDSGTWQVGNCKPAKLVEASVDLHVAFSAKNDDVSRLIIGGFAIDMMPFRSLIPATNARADFRIHTERPRSSAANRYTIPSPVVVFGTESLPLFDVRLRLLVARLWSWFHVQKLAAPGVGRR